MKKFIIIILIIAAIFVVLPAFEIEAVVTEETQQQIKPSPAPTGDQVRNLINVKNEGDDKQIRTQEQEDQDDATGEGLQVRNQNAVQNMSQVATQVQLLLQIRTTGGIGDQVREVARVQNQAQIQIEEQLNKLDSKGKLAKFLTGTDYGAVNNLKQQVEQNQMRIKELQQLRDQLSDQEDVSTVQEAIQALIQENTLLQVRISTEEQTKSLFGWLIRLFSK